MKLDYDRLARILDKDCRDFLDERGNLPGNKEDPIWQKANEAHRKLAEDSFFSGAKAALLRMSMLTKIAQAEERIEDERKGRLQKERDRYETKGVNTK